MQRGKFVMTFLSNFSLFCLSFVFAYTDDNTWTSMHYPYKTDTLLEKFSTVFNKQIKEDNSTNLSSRQTVVVDDIVF